MRVYIYECVAARRVLGASVTACLLVIAVTFAECWSQDSRLCCMPPYLGPATTPGQCYCDFTLLNECEDSPGNECSKAGYQAAYNGYCMSGSGTCQENAGTTILTESSGDWSCTGTGTISECDSSADCSCSFEVDSWPSTENVPVSICGGDGCND